MRLPDNVKQTSGGKFNRTDYPLYFIASNTEFLVKADYPNVLVAVNEVHNDKTKEDLKRLCGTRNVLIDSGIYSLTMEHVRKNNIHMDSALKLHPSEIDGFDKLRDRYYEIATTYNETCWGIIELDLGGPKIKPQTRAMIEKDTGIVPIPVYHPFSDGWDYYDDLAGHYDRLCFGNLVKANGPIRERLMFTASERQRKYPYLWTHLLGVTASQNWNAMDIHGSCDSSSWLNPLRWPPTSSETVMLAKTGNFASNMWYDDYEKGIQFSSSLSFFRQKTLEVIREDTHT